MSFIITPPYPSDQFYLTVKNAIGNVHRRVQAPEALIAMEFLGNMAASAQGLYDVRLPPGQIRPLSLNLLTIADSGERKTGVHNLVAAPLYAYDRSRMEKHEAAVEEYKIQENIWESVNAGLLRQLTKLTAEGKPIDDVRRQLTEHAATRPAQPRLRRIMRQNASHRAIIDSLQGDGESIAFNSDEGEIILKGGALNQAGMINKAWDGDAMLSMDRRDGESVIAYNPRVTVSYMVQSQVLQKFLDRRGDIIRGSGHWARYLVAWPASTQGFRSCLHLQNTEWHDLEKFHELMRQLLDEFGRRVDAGVTTRATLEFSQEAIVRWTEIANHVERDIGPRGHLHDIKDFASKFMEIAGRVAALLHIFSEQEGKISDATLERAVRIVEWHADEFKRIFNPEGGVPQELADAQVLEKYLHNQYWCMGLRFAQKNLVLKNGPIRPVSRLDAALNCLIDTGTVWIGIGQRRERYINFNPAHFGSFGADQMAARF